MREKTNNGVEAFWRSIGEKRGGPVELYSFATYIGHSGSDRAEPQTGLAYVSAGSLWFETVESPRTVMGFVIPGVVEVFEPFEASLAIPDIASVGLVSLDFAQRSVLITPEEAGEPEEIAGLRRLVSFMSGRVVMFTLRDGSRHFFELDREKEFLLFFKGIAG